MITLLQQLQALEVELHHPGIRCNRERLDELLHPDFQEVGRSGRAYNRETVIGFLCSQVSPPVVSSNRFALVELASDVALLTYQSAHAVDGGGFDNHALRSSIWIKMLLGWQLRYHQGTAAAP